MVFIALRGNIIGALRVVVRNIWIDFVVEIGTIFDLRCICFS